MHGKPPSWLRPRWMLAVVGLASLLGCGDRQGERPNLVLEPTRSGMQPRLTAQQFRELTGVDRLPLPKHPAALGQATQRHGGGFRGAIVVDVTVDATGRVERVDLPNLPQGAPPRVVLQRSGEPASNARAMAFEHHPEFFQAAEAALREVMFAPAMRDGEPVSHTMRMTIHFGPS